MTFKMPEVHWPAFAMQYGIYVGESRFRLTDYPLFRASAILWFDEMRLGLSGEARRRMDRD